MRKHNEQSLKEILGHLSQDQRFSQNLSEIKLRETWNEQMGETISKYTSKIYFRKGILYVKLDSAVLRQELYINGDMIKAKLNVALGSEMVKELSLQ